MELPFVSNFHKVSLTIVWIECNIFFHRIFVLVISRIESLRWHISAPKFKRILNHTLFIHNKKTSKVDRKKKEKKNPSSSDKIFPQYLWNNFTKEYYVVYIESSSYVHLSSSRYTVSTKASSQQPVVMMKKKKKKEKWSEDGKGIKIRRRKKKKKEKKREKNNY